jgi:hypothetical protein
MIGDTLFTPIKSLLVIDLDEENSTKPLKITQKKAETLKSPIVTTLISKKPDSPHSTPHVRLNPSANSSNVIPEDLSPIKIDLKNEK